MIRTIFSFSICSLLATNLFAQPLYMPRDVQQAFKKGTRSADGNPGKNYWQNRARYNITISATPPARTIKGKEEIVYVNNSPDALKEVIIKLYMNIHKPGAMRYGDADAGYLTSGTHIDAISVNGQAQKWEDPRFHSTWQVVPLPQPLNSKDSMRLSIDWHYDLSERSGREGMLDSTTYFMAYFYPRVAVYDDYLGWDMMEFTDAQEFYNDFNDYTLTVNVPANYVVWATGDFTNPREVLQPAIADKLEKSMTSEENIHIASLDEMLGKKVTLQQPVNSWKWSANNITDVALCFSDHYVWDAASAVVDEQTKRRASVQAAFDDKSKDFHYMVGFGQHALRWLSNNWPGVPYPFPKTTIVQGFAGMEYPMMVNDESYADTNFSRFVCEHEIAHTWFPFLMGINETRYGFMDEGWATTFELLIGRSDMSKETADELYRQFRVNNWINDPNAEQDVPIITPANILNGPALGNNEYGKASLGYLAVKDLLGDDMFRKCLHGYISRWRGKHPIPWDYFNSFSNISGKNLNWFFSNWYFSNYYIDFAIEKASKTTRGYNLAIKNIGGMVAPFDLVVTYSDGSTQALHQTPAIWATNQKQATIAVAAKKTITSIQIDGGVFMDADESNNKWTPTK